MYATLEPSCSKNVIEWDAVDNRFDLHYVCFRRSRLHLQKETLSSKPGTLANIDELEKLIPSIKDAKAAEINVAVSKAVEKALAEERANVAAQVLHCLSGLHMLLRKQRSCHRRYADY